MKPIAEGQMIGHAQMIFDRLQRLHASMRLRGASEAAIGRLPKLPTYEQPIELTPVLLGRKRRPRIKESSPVKGTDAPERSGRPKARRRSGLVTGRAELAPSDAALKRRIVATVARCAGIAEHAIADRGRTADVAPARHIAWRLMRELSGLSTVAMAILFEQGQHSTILYGLARVRDHIAASRRWSEVYWSARRELLGAGHELVEDFELKTTAEAA